MDIRTRLGRDLAADRHDGLLRLFLDDGAPPPVLVWSPAPEALSTGPLVRLLTYWQGLRLDNAPPRATAIDPTDMRFILGHVMLVDAVNDGADFVYRLYGSKIAACYGRDMTGRRASDFPGRLGLFFGATYHAALLRREPLYTEHEDETPASPVERWHRLILPLTAPDGAVVRFLVGNIPVGAEDCGPMFPHEDGTAAPGG